MSEPIYTIRGARDMDQARTATAKAEAARVTAEAQARIAELRRAERAEEARDQRVLRAERDADRAKRRARRGKALSGRRSLLVVGAVMAASLVIAWPAQQAAFARLGWFSFGVPVLVEGLTWVGAVLTSVAVEHRRPAGAYRAMTWGAALLAAGINYAHGQHQGVLVGVVYALASLAGVGAWEAYVRSRTHEHSGRDSAGMRRDLSRRWRYPLVWRDRNRLLAAMGADLEPETAWLAAWRSRYGADPGVTARLLKRQHKAMGKIATALAARPEGLSAMPGLAAMPGAGVDLYTATLSIPTALPLPAAVSESAPSIAPATPQLTPGDVPGDRPALPASSLESASEAAPGVGPERSEQHSGATAGRSRSGKRATRKASRSGGRSGARSERAPGLPAGVASARELTADQLAVLARAWRSERPGRPTPYELQQRFGLGYNRAISLLGAVWPANGPESEPRPELRLLERSEHDLTGPSGDGVGEDSEGDSDEATG